MAPTALCSQMRLQKQEYTHFQAIKIKNPSAETIFYVDYCLALKALYVLLLKLSIFSGQKVMVMYVKRRYFWQDRRLKVLERFLSHFGTLQ